MNHWHPQRKGAEERAQTKLAALSAAAPAFDRAVKAATRGALAQLAQVERLVDDVVTAAFASSRCPRSPEYRDGVRALLLHRALCRALRCPWPLGTASADAWFAGVEEGKDMWRHQVQAMHATWLKGLA